VLVVLEATDVLFAVDSIPAVLGITRDVFIVYTSNIFAVLGLRALSFVLASLIQKLRYLKVGLALVLGFVGLKMLLPERVHVPEWMSLLIVVALLGGAALASLVIGRGTSSPVPATPAPTSPAPTSPPPPTVAGE